MMLRTRKLSSNRKVSFGLAPESGADQYVSL